MVLNTELLARSAGPNRRRFCLVEIESIDDLQWLEPRSQHFGLMTAIGLVGVSEKTLQNAADLLVHRGLAYLNAWGTDCERWHDIVDRADVDHLTALGVYPNGDWDPIMTTWHEGESLEDAVWDFRYTGIASGHYEQDCSDGIIAATRRYLDHAQQGFHLAGRGHSR